MHIREWKKPTCKDYIPNHDPKYVAFWKRQNYGNGKTFSGSRGCRKRGRNKRTTGDSEAVKTLRMTYIISDTIERSAPRVSPNANCELRVVRMCRCGFIDCTEYTTLAGGAENGEAERVWGQG